jgi:toxin CptA
MTRQPTRPPLRLRPRPSRRLAAFLLAVHAAVVVVALLLPAPWLLRLVLAIAALLSLTYGLAVHVRRILPWSVVEATWQPDGAWVLTLASGREVPARLLPSSYISPALVVLNFRVDWWLVRSLVLPHDSLDPDLHRRLRARLRLAGHTAPSAPDRAA